MCFCVFKCVCSTWRWSSVLIIISASTLYLTFLLHTHMHTHTHTHTQLVVISCFYLSRYDGAEGEQVVVHLSAPILTHISTFTGSIMVYVTVEDLPNYDPRYTAEFGKSYSATVKTIIFFMFTKRRVKWHSCAIQCKLQYTPSQ